jgi:hypothetical protein
MKLPGLPGTAREEHLAALASALVTTANWVATARAMVKAAIGARDFDLFMVVFPWGCAHEIAGAKEHKHESCRLFNQ